MRILTWAVRLAVFLLLVAFAAKNVEPVTLRFYASSEDRIMPEMLANYAKSITDLLLEFEKASDGKITVEKFAPNPATEDEDKAKEDGLQGDGQNVDRRPGAAAPPLDAQAGDGCAKGEGEE